MVENDDPQLAHLQGPDKYSKLEYWEHRYNKDKDFFDWYLDYKDMKKYIAKLVPNKEARILSIGAGTSALTEELVKAGYKNLMDIDNSPNCVKIMSAHYKKNRDSNLASCA